MTGSAEQPPGKPFVWDRHAHGAGCVRRTRRERLLASAAMRAELDQRQAFAREALDRYAQQFKYPSFDAMVERLADGPQAVANHRANREAALASLSAREAAALAPLLDRQRRAAEMIQPGKGDHAPQAATLAAGGRVLAEVPASFDPRRPGARTARDMDAAPLVKLAAECPAMFSKAGVEAACRWAEAADRAFGGQGRAATMRYDDTPRGEFNPIGDLVAMSVVRKADLVLSKKQRAILDAVMRQGMKLGPAAAMVFGGEARNRDEQRGLAKAALADACWALVALFGLQEDGAGSAPRGWSFQFHGRV